MRFVDFDSYTITVKPNQNISPKIWGMKSTPQREDLAELIVKTYWLSRGNQPLHRYIVAWYLVIFKFDYVATMTQLLNLSAGLNTLSARERSHIYNAFVRANASRHKKDGVDFKFKKFHTSLKIDHSSTFWEVDNYWDDFGRDACNYYKSEEDLIECIQLCHADYPHLGKLVNKYVQAKTALMYMYDKNVYTSKVKMTINHLYQNISKYDDVLSAFSKYKQKRSGWPSLTALCNDEFYRRVGGVM